MNEREQLEALEACDTKKGSGGGQLIDTIAALLSIGAGIYLLQYNSVSVGDGTSWFAIIGHGMGIYFIGRGLFMWRGAYLASRSRDHLAYLAEWARYDHEDEIERAAAVEALPVD